MADIDHRMPHTLGWVDLATRDAGAATAFYRELLGWKIEHTVTPLGAYHVAWAGGQETAGITHQSPETRAAGIPPAWLPYFRVASMDVTIDAIEDMGGKVDLPPFYVPGETRMAVVVDPAGAAFGLFEGPSDRGLHIRTDPGALCWAEVLTRDVSTTEEFYETVFGWEPSADQMGDTTYTTFKLGKLHVAGMMPMPETVPKEAPSHWLPYFDVADAAAAASDAAWLGGQVATEPMTVGPGTFAVLEDLHGAVFAVFETKFEHSTG